ncbi:MAG: glycosyltransferase family 1 protein [bacterium]
MVIGIDASRADKKIKTGTEWYSYFLIEELKKITAGTEHKIILYSRESLHCGLAKLPANWKNKILRWPPKYLWTNIRLSLEMLFNPPDVLFIPAHSVPLIYAKNTVATWHDIGFEKFKHLYTPQAYWYHKWTVRFSLKHATKVIVISEFTKNEILDLFGQFDSRLENKISVVYNGYDNKKYRADLDKNKIRQALEKYKIKWPYVFFVGRLEEKKNIAGLVRAFAKLRESARIGKLINANNLKLVLAGRRGYGYDKVNKNIKENNLQDDVIELGWTDQEDVPYLLAGAEMFCFLSFYEGFGIPVLEAMACGTPVICSDIPPLREVAGDAALFVDPHNAQEIALAMRKVFNDSVLRENLINKGLEREKEFSWEKCAKETWDVIMQNAKIKMKNVM